MARSRSGSSREVPGKHALWVYYKGSFTPAMKAAVRGGAWTGDGCCTNGHADVSYLFRNRASAVNAARRLAKLTNVGWVEVYPQWIPSLKAVFGRRPAKLALGLPSKQRAAKWLKEKPRKKSRAWLKGSMHRALEIAAGKPIPTSALRKAMKRNDVVGRRARMLLNLRGVKTGPRPARPARPARRKGATKLRRRANAGW